MTRERKKGGKEGRKLGEEGMGKKEKRGGKEKRRGEEGRRNRGRTIERVWMDCWTVAMAGVARRPLWDPATIPGEGGVAVGKDG